MMYYAEFYKKNAGRLVKAVMTDGEIFTAYISAQDNEPDPESIIVGRTELFTHEIETVEVAV